MFSQLQSLEMRCQVAASTSGRPPVSFAMPTRRQQQQLLLGRHKQVQLVQAPEVCRSRMLVAYAAATEVRLTFCPDPALEFAELPCLGALQRCGPGCTSRVWAALSKLSLPGAVHHDDTSDCPDYGYVWTPLGQKCKAAHELATRCEDTVR